MEFLPWLLPLTGLLLAVLLGLAVRAGNLKRERRHLQLPMPLLGLLVAAVAVLGASLLTDLARDLLAIPLIQRLMNLTAPQVRLHELTNLAVLVVCNLLVLAGMAVLKLLLRLALSRWKGRPPQAEAPLPLRGVWSLIYCFYERREERLTLRLPWVSVERTLCYGLRLLAVAFGLFLLALHLPVFQPDAAWVPADFLRRCADAVYVWPAVSFLIVKEMQWYLGGEPKGTPPGIYARANTAAVLDYQALEEQYRRQFPERFAASFCVDASETGGEAGGEVSAENKAEAALVERLKRAGHTPDRGFFICLQHLLRREDALINAAVFSEFGEYLFQYLNLLLARGENLLFLCADAATARLVRDGVEQKLRDINGLHPVWIVKSGDALHDTLDTDVMVMTPQFILDDSILIGQNHFFQNLSMVVLMGAEELIARDGALLTLVAKRLEQVLRDKYQRRTPQYVCFSDSIPPETSNAVKQLLDLRGELYICDGGHSRRDTRLMLWNYEAARTEKDGCFMAQDRLFVNRKATYWGVSVPFACVAVKYGVPEICIAAPSAPCLQITDSLRHNFDRLSSYFGPGITAADLEHALRIQSFQTIREDAEFLIVEDALYNIPLTLSRLCRFGGPNSGMIHLISKPYLLRDYFAANAQRFVGSDAGINMIVPALADRRQSTVIRLLCDASGQGVESETLITLIAALDPTAKNDLRRALEVFRTLAFPEEDTDGALETCFLFSNSYVFNAGTGEYDRKVYIRLRWDSALQHFREDARPGILSLRGMEEHLSVPANCLRQYYVPSQNIVHNGRLFGITDIDPEAGRLTLRESTDQLNAPVDYIQVRRYTLAETPTLARRYPARYRREDGRCTTGYEVALFDRAHVVVETPGYFALDPVDPTLDLSKGLQYCPLGDARQKKQRREYPQTVAASFQIKDVGEDKADRVSFLLAVMMNELMKTVFPYSHPCIAVCPVLNDPEALQTDPFARAVAEAYPQVQLSADYPHRSEDVEVLIFQDHPNDIGLIRTLLLNEQYPFGAFFDILYDYLQWYEAFQPVNNLSNRYLWFGGDQAPDCFDFETLRTVCDEFDRMKRSDSIVVDVVGSAGLCSYCHRSLGGVGYTRMQDHAGAHDRRICPRCARMLVRSEKELSELYQKARRYLCDSFQITLPDDITPHFATAETIRRKMRTGSERSVLGFADLGKRELWIESDGPATNVMSVLVHELTHFWQKDNLDTDDRDILEGQASYVEVQYLRHARRRELAEWKDAELRGRDDPYGRGYRALTEALQARGETNSFRYLQEQSGGDT